MLQSKERSYRERERGGEIAMAYISDCKCDITTKSGLCESERLSRRRGRDTEGEKVPNEWKLPDRIFLSRSLSFFGETEEVLSRTSGKFWCRGEEKSANVWLSWLTVSLLVWFNSKRNRFWFLSYSFHSSHFLSNCWAKYGSLLNQFLSYISQIFLHPKNLRTSRTSVTNIFKLQTSFPYKKSASQTEVSSFVNWLKLMTYLLTFHLCCLILATLIGEWIFCHN